MNDRNHKLTGGSSRRRDRGFTLVEVSISIAIVAFALVAIIGVLPTGMTVQKENREDTIINQDGPLLLEAIRTGTTNLSYIDANLDILQIYRNGTLITNFPNPAVPNPTARQIIGLMSQPKYDGTPDVWWTESEFLSNSGPLAMEASGARQLAFRYRVRSEIVPFRASRGRTRALTNNLHEIKLTFRWPVLPSGAVGNGRQVFRTQASGHLQQTVETNNGMVMTMFFFRPDVFAPHR